MGAITLPFGCKELEQLLNIISKSDGRYVLGDNSFWHGGVHIKLSGNTKAIVMPFDGKIVAHRTMRERTAGVASFTMDSEGERTSSDDEDAFDSSFSFVLSEHTFETPKKEKITFFILHMHLLCYEHYQEFHKVNPPPYLNNNVQHFVNKDEDDGGSLVGKGVNLRQEAKSGDNVISVVKKGSEIEFKYPNEYDHSRPRGYQAVKIKDAPTISITKATVKTGKGKDNQWRLLPNDNLYKKFGLLHSALINNVGLFQIGAPLIIKNTNTYIGNLTFGQEIYLFEEPLSEGLHRIIPDNINQITKPNFFGLEELLKFLGDEGIGEADIDEEDASLGIDFHGVLEDNFFDDIEKLELYVLVDPNNLFPRYASIEVTDKVFSSFIVNSFDENQCGLPAYSEKSETISAYIPYGEEITSISSVSISQLRTEGRIEINDKNIGPFEEGFIYCGPKYIDRKVNEVTGSFNSVEVLNPPIEVSSGSVIGYPGAHDRQHVCHMELWLRDLNFMKNKNEDEFYENSVVLPQGTSAKQKKVENRTGKKIEVSVSPPGLKYASISSEEKKSKDPEQKTKGIRKVVHEGTEYYAYRSDLGGWDSKKKTYTVKETKIVGLYDAHPELETEFISYETSTLPKEVSLEDVPGLISIDSEDYFPIGVDQNEEKTLPAGTKAFIKTIQKKLPQSLEITVDPPGLRPRSISKSEKVSNKPGETNGIRKILHDGKTYYAYHSHLGGWTGSIYGYKKQAKVTVYERHPEKEYDHILYQEIPLPNGVNLYEIPTNEVIEKKNYYPVKVEGDKKIYYVPEPEFNKHKEKIKPKIIYYIEKDVLNQHRLNYYDWSRFFSKTNFSELTIEPNGYFESKNQIIDAVLDNYQNSVDNGTMEQKPSYQTSHPMSHLIVEAGSDWSIAQKNATSWDDAIIDSMFRDNVSSLEEDAGISKDKATKIFEQTIKKYYEDISFYDELNGIEKLPSKDAVYHAHPARFLAHLDFLSSGFGAPWVPFAWGEYKKYTKIRAPNSPLREKISEYFDETSFSQGTYANNWCGAFVSWCFAQTEFKGSNVSGAGAAFDWLPPSMSKKHRTDVDGWLNCELIDNLDDVFVGAVIVFNHSHVAFVVGQTETGNSLVYLGGNQSDGYKVAGNLSLSDGSGRRTICTNPISKKKFNKKFWLTRPRNYKPKGFEKTLPVISADGTILDRNTTR